MIKVVVDLNSIRKMTLQSDLPETPYRDKRSTNAKEKLPKMGNKCAQLLHSTRTVNIFFIGHEPPLFIYYLFL